MAKDMVVWKPQINKTGATTLHQRKSGVYASGKPRKYTKKTHAKGNIFAKAGKKASGEQRFLGKTLPKMAWGAAKWAWRHPIASTALFMAPTALKKIANAQKGLVHPEFRQFNKKGRKVYDPGGFRRGTKII